MKKQILCFFLAFPAFGVSTQQLEFHAFFTALRNAAADKDTTKLKTLIYPFRDKVEDMQAELIESILEGGETRNGDGAFSIRALDSLLASHLDQIGPVEKGLYRQLSGDLIFGKVIGSFSRNDVFVMDYRDVRIILLRDRNGLRLFFWENLNNLLPAPRVDAGADT